MSEGRESPQEISPQILQEAAEWFVRLHTEDPSSDACAAWFTWIEADLAHRAAFAQIQQSWDISGVTTGLVWPTPEELALAATDRSTARRMARDTPRLVFTLVAAGVAAIAVALFAVGTGPLGGWAMQWLGAERIATGRGEQQSAMLVDGSRVELGGLTAVAIKFTPEQRLVVAEEGETHYRVARDPARPFVVHSGSVSITALGTAFSVRREDASVSVSVSEGLVEVKSIAPRLGEKPAAPVRVNAGERARFERGALSAVAGERLAADPWRPGRLRFEDEPLRVVVASVNRYTRQPIELADAALHELHFTGTIFAEDIDRWLESIEVVFPIKVRKDGARVRIEHTGEPLHRSTS